MEEGSRNRILQREHCLMVFRLFFGTVLGCLLLANPALADQTEKLLKGARSCLGDVYDAGYYAGGPPPEGRGACPEVVYYALLEVGLDLQERVDRDIRDRRSHYPNVRDRNIDYRWCPNLIVWFRKHTSAVPLKSDWKPGDIIFWSILDDGVADHVGIISDKKARDGTPLVIHNFPPKCREDNSLNRWTKIGHFRM